MQNPRQVITKAQLLDRILRERNDAVDDELGILFRIDALGENALERCNEFCEIICINARKARK